MMKEFKISNTGSGQLFTNRFLESLTRTNFAFPVILFLVLSMLILIYGVASSEINVSGMIWLFPVGMIFFTLVEYLIHRFLFHFKADTEKEKNFQYLIHGVHHEFPKDKDRLVMPPLVTVLLAVVFYFIFKLIMGEGVFVFFPGFISGYSVYLLIHFALHRYHPPKNFFKYLWKHHSLHHYKSEEGCYSVSFPFWDYIFGTMPAGKSSDKILENKLPDIF
jgi:4-hydroxysphinganine ceramide fatty acyl 2-hydroxylase